MSAGQSHQDITSFGSTTYSKVFIKRYQKESRRNANDSQIESDCKECHKERPSRVPWPGRESQHESHDTVVN
jgi:hypothetical protein